MVNISKKKLKPSIEKAILDEFLRHVQRNKDSSHVKEFLFEFLTSAERTQLAKRFAIVVMLLRGYSFIQIQKTLQVSPPTIVKQWKNLKNGKLAHLRSDDMRFGHAIVKNSLSDSLMTLLKEGPPPKVGKGRWNFLKN